MKLFIENDYPHLDLLKSEDMILNQQIGNQAISEFIKEELKDSRLLLDFKKNYLQQFEDKRSHSLLSFDFLSSGGVMDCLSVRSHVYPEILIKRNFTSILSFFKHELHLNRRIYLTGFDFFTLFIISVFFERGYRCFGIIQNEQQQPMNKSETLDKLKKYFIDIEIEIIELEKIVLMRPDGEFIICSQSAEFISDNMKESLSYFNYLAAGGKVIDLYSNQSSWLKDECKATGMIFISERFFYALSEWIVFDELNLFKAKINFKEYVRCLGI